MKKVQMPTVSNSEYAFEYSMNPFEVNFKRCCREPKTWKEELGAIALNIVNQAGSRPIMVCSSGGIDSEIVCRLLYEQGIHFKVITIAHSAGTNESDIYFAKKWCAEHGVEQKIVQLDLPDFFKKTIERYIDDGYVSDNIFRYFQIFLLETVESLGGFAVLGGGEIIFDVGSVQAPKPSDVYLEFRTSFVAMLEWMKRKGNAHCPNFYFSSPEAVASYLDIPIVQSALRNPEIFVHPSNTYLLKRLVMHSVWPDLVSRKKMGGYEEVAELRSTTQARLKRHFGDAIKTWRLPVELARKQLEYRSGFVAH